MAKVLFETTITQYGKDGKVKPTSPLFAFVNDGNKILFLNNFPIPTGGVFGINAAPVVASFMDLGIAVSNTTEYDMTFRPHYDGGSAQLIEVTFKMLN